jgi:hypothetical protein
MASDAVRLSFTEGMYEAACDGRKTQTRRVIVRPERLNGLMLAGEEGEWCPYGGAGTRLGLTEPFRVVVTDREGVLVARRRDAAGNAFAPVEYKWGNAGVEWRRLPESHFTAPAAQPRASFLSPRFMPLWAVRRWAVVEGVRVEHIQDITEADCYAEGTAAPWPPRGPFAALWDEINGPRGHGWEANPYVWAITFRMEEQADE